MGALTEAVVHRAVRDAADWRAQGTDVPFAVNLFPPSLGDLELPDRIVRILSAGGLTTECLTVEITEDFLLGNIRRARKVLDMLRHAGIRVAIDDFGSGYSALSYLRDLPIDELKLDRQFIAPILDDARADAIVSTIIDLAHRLGHVVCRRGRGGCGHRSPSCGARLRRDPGLLLQLAGRRIGCARRAPPDSGRCQRQATVQGRVVRRVLKTSRHPGVSPHPPAN